MPIFEIRIPTYKRPAMLLRALQSLRAQTEEDWVAFVYDDSPMREAEVVVRALGEPRVRYQCNPVNLGAARNIDQVFRKEPRTDARYFKILSDDNLMHPHCLARGRETVERTGCQIVLLNEIIIDEHGNPDSAGATTRGEWFPHGMIQPLTLYASLFLNEGISDGGLFWSRSCLTDLEVGTTMTEVCLQEACRSLKVVEPLYFVSEPCASFSSLPVTKVVRQTQGNRIVGRGGDEIRRYLWKRGRSAIKAEAVAFAERLCLRQTLQGSLESALRPWEGRGIGRRDWNRRFRGLARKWATSNPVEKFLASKPGSF